VKKRAFLSLYRGEAEGRGNPGRRIMALWGDLKGQKKRGRYTILDKKGYPRQSGGNPAF